MPRMNTTGETFQSHLIDTTIFQTKSFNVLSEFALLVSCATCSASSAIQKRSFWGLIRVVSRIFDAKNYLKLV